MEKDFVRLRIPAGKNGTKVTIVIENPQTNIPYFSSVVTAISNNIYLRDILERRKVELLNHNQVKKEELSLVLKYEEPEYEMLIGPNAGGSFIYKDIEYAFELTLKKSLNKELILKGDERTNGLLVVSGTVVFDCQFFQYENQLGTEYLYGTVVCSSLAEMLAKGYPIISDEREGLNLKDPYIAAFSEAVSGMLAETVRREQLRLSHIDHATTSRRTQVMIERILNMMNKIAVDDLGIILSPGPGTGKYGPYNTGRAAVLRFSTPFYYRRNLASFHVSMYVDRQQLPDQEILSFTYDLPESIQAEPLLSDMLVAELPEDGRFEWNVVGEEVGARGKIGVSVGPFSAFCEIVIADHSAEKGTVMYL
jgi:hypothetical protein